MTTERLTRRAQYALEQVADSPPLERLKTLIKIHAVAVAKRDEVSTAFQKIFDQVSPEIRAGYLQAPKALAVLWQGVIDDAIAAGGLRDDLSPRLLRLLLIGTLIWIPDWYKPAGPSTPEEISETVITLFLEGAGRR
jgi:hypothetical protein